MMIIVIIIMIIIVRLGDEVPAGLGEQAPQGRKQHISLCVYTCIYIYIYTHVYVHTRIPAKTITQHINT